MGIFYNSSEGVWVVDSMQPSDPPDQPSLTIPTILSSAEYSSNVAAR